MSYSITMEYGDYSFSPVPMATINKIYDRTEDQTAIGSTFTIALQGYLYDSSNSLVSIFGKQTELRTAFDEDGKYFAIKCDGSVMFECYPRIIGELAFNQTSNNWVTTCEFTISLEFDNEPVDQALAGEGENIDGATEEATLMPPFIRSSSENWSLEVVADQKRYSLTTSAGTDKSPYQFRLTHNVSAVGKRHYDDSGLTKEAWEQAKVWVESQLGYDEDKVIAEDIINVDFDNLDPFNHVRTREIDENGGSFAVTESWLVLDSHSAGFAAGNVTEDYNVDYNSTLDSANDTITINGTIQGLETIDYNDPYKVTTTAYEEASGHWGSVQGILAILPRAQAIADVHSLSLNIIPLSYSVAHSLGQGTITYNYTYDDRPSNCITGNGFTIKSEHIQMSNVNATDVFAQIQVPGRAKGPILMDISTVTAPTRDVSVELVVNKITGCSDASNFITPNDINDSVEDFLCIIESDLTGVYDQVFKHQDSDNWSPKTGRYSRQVGWTMGICSSAALETTFC